MKNPLHNLHNIENLKIIAALANNPRAAVMAVLLIKDYEGVKEYLDARHQKEEETDKQIELPSLEEREEFNQLVHDCIQEMRLNNDSKN